MMFEFLRDPSADAGDVIEACYQAVLLLRERDHADVSVARAVQVFPELSPTERDLLERTICAIKGKERTALEVLPRERVSFYIGELEAITADRAEGPWPDSIDLSQAPALPGDAEGNGVSAPPLAAGAWTSDRTGVGDGPIPAEYPVT